MGSGGWICSWVLEQILEEEESSVALNSVQMREALERVAPPLRSAAISSSDSRATYFHGARHCHAWLFFVVPLSDFCPPLIVLVRYVH